MSRRLLLFALFPILLGAQSGSGRIRSDYLAVKAELHRHIEFFSLDSDPGTPALVERQWSLGADWMAAWLATHPEETCAKAMADLGVEGDIDCVRLDANSFLTIAVSDPVGNAFILTRSDGRYRKAWSTADRLTGLDDPEQAGLLKDWHLGDDETHESHWRNRFLLASVDSLPPDAAGHARFALHALYQYGAGATMAEQLSVWSWDGAAAHPLIAHGFAQSLDEGGGWSLEGDLLKVREKREYRTFHSSGAGPGRQVELGCCASRRSELCPRVKPSLFPNSTGSMNSSAASSNPNRRRHRALRPREP